MANWFTELESFFITTEAEVVKIIAEIKADAVIAEADINNVMKWVANNAPAIAADIQQVLVIVQALGIINPGVAAAIAAANASVVALNAFAAAEKAGQSNSAAVIAGYVAVKQAQSAVATVAVAAAQAPAVAKAA